MAQFANLPPNEGFHYEAFTTSHCFENQGFDKRQTKGSCWGAHWAFSFQETCQTEIIVEDTAFHLVCDCPVFAFKRKQFLGDYTLSEGEACNIRIDDLLGYLNDIKFL